MHTLIDVLGGWLVLSLAAATVWAILGVRRRRSVEAHTPRDSGRPAVVVVPREPAPRMEAEAARLLRECGMPYEVTDDGRRGSLA